MIDVVGEAAAHQMPRMGTLASGTEKDVSSQKAEQVREVRPVERSGEGEQTKKEASGEDNTRTRTRLEDGGKIIVEKYNQEGRLLKRTPPGYLPFGEIA